MLAAVALLGAGSIGATLGHAEMTKAVPAQTISVKRRKSAAERLVNRYILSNRISRPGWSVAHGQRMAAKMRNRRRNKRAHRGS